MNTIGQLKPVTTKKNRLAVCTKWSDLKTKNITAFYTLPWAGDGHA